MTRETSSISPTSPATEDEASLAAKNTTDETAESSAEKQVRSNFVIMVLYQVVMRTGWIFKTESIIMPAVMDAMGGPAWLRGCLPMLNRFGQSVPPMLAAHYVSGTSLKKRVLSVCSFLMGVAFILLAAFWYWTGGQGSVWLPTVFLVIYALFFASVGVNQLSVSTVIGKLIPVRRRGRLILYATTIGSVSAISCAWLLLRYWLTKEEGNFAAIFLFAGTAFIIGSLIAGRMVESPDTKTKSIGLQFRAVARSVFSTLRSRRNFRNLAIAASLFGMSMTLFPHYQALARERLGMGMDHLMNFLIAQNIGLAIFSIPAGRLADRYGNRLVLRFVLLALCAAPILSLILVATESAKPLFLSVFVIVGLTPITMRVFANFTLELAEKKDQPRLLGILSLCMAGPAILTSTLLGLTVDLFGFEPVFILVIICLLCSWWTTIAYLQEPRRNPEGSGEKPVAANERL